MSKKPVSRLFLFFILIFMWSCIDKNEEIYERAFYIMGSRIEFRLECENKDICDKAVNDSHDRMKEIDYIFSNYRDDSVLYKVNTNAGKAPVKVPREFIDLTEESVKFSQLTNGTFDITIGKMFILWKESVKEGQIPTSEQVKEELRCVGYEKINLDKENNEVSFASDCLSLDYGAIGKGYAVDEVIKILKKYGIKRGLVNFGGNMYGFNDEDQAWTVGVRNPADTEKVLAVVSLINKGVATSGDYEKYFEFEGKRYSHILNPRTGHPVEHISSVTAIASSATEADVYSTAFSVMGLDATKKLIDSKEGLDVMFISNDDDVLDIFKSEGFRMLERN